ncbi:MAG: hypothetical protein ISS92_02910 [Candidatus Omnitrophica bacterium]|nr:hypothetical protein [Candidatus Omnitrophota bacterium]
MEKINLEINDLAVNPSPITRDLLNRVSALDARYQRALSGKNPLRKLTALSKVEAYLKNDFREFFVFLRDYKRPVFKEAGAKKIRLLLKEFENLFEKLILNNLALGYFYLKKGMIGENPVLTAEDEKILYLKRFFHGKVSESEFKARFGHYALNAYELSSRRFEEYSHDELLSLAKLAGKVPEHKKTTLDEYLSLPPSDILPVLIALRELAKYRILFVVRDIRGELLNISKEKNIPDIFSKTFSEIPL